MEMQKQEWHYTIFLFKVRMCLLNQIACDCMVSEQLFKMKVSKLYLSLVICKMLNYLRTFGLNSTLKVTNHC